MASPQEAMTSPEALQEFWAASGMKSQIAIDHVIPGEHFYDGIWYNEVFPAEALDRAKEFEFRDTDVVLATYAKSGTTWMSAILDELLVVTGSPAEKLEFLEMNIPDMPTLCIENIENMPDPRFYKTHVLPGFFKNPPTEKKTKFIVINRNVKDTLVSFYHFHKVNPLLGKFKGSFYDFMEMVKVDRIRNWFNYVEAWWAYKDDDRFLFLTYEDMKEDTPREIRKVCDFVGFDVSDDVIEDIAKKTSFSSMRAGNEKNKTNDRALDAKDFFRKGIVGDWRNHFTDEMNTYIDTIYKERIESKGLILKF